MQDGRGHGPYSLRAYNFIIPVFDQILKNNHDKHLPDQQQHV